MRKNILHFAYAALLICVVLTSCKKAEVPASASDPQVSFSLQSDNSLFVFANGGNGQVKPSVVWLSGVVNISQFKLDAKRGGIASLYTSDALNNVNLFSASPALSNISIPKGDYTDVKTSIVYAQTSGAPIPVMLNGNFTTGAGVIVPIEFDMADNLEIKVAVSNIIADGTRNFNISVVMHLNLLLTNISAQDLDAATRTNGNILISKTINTALYNKMKANLNICAASALSSMSK